MLYGEKVRLRAIEESDIEVMQRWLNEVESLVWLQAVPHLRSKQELSRGMGGRPGESQRLIVETSDGRPIGLAQLSEIDWIHRHAELSLVVGEPDHRWRGFEEDAVRVVAGYAFRVLNLHRVGVALVGENDRLRKIYESCGFKAEGLRENFYWAGDRYLDQVMLRLLDHELRRPQSLSGPAS